MAVSATAVLVPAAAILGHAAAQAVTQVATPKAITPPPGNVAFLFGHAIGTQGYTCLPTGDGTNAWTVNPARPEATLFTDGLGQPEQIVTHFLSLDVNPNQNAPKELPAGGNATWQCSFDSSRVWATATGHIDAGSDDKLQECGFTSLSVAAIDWKHGGPVRGRTAWQRHLYPAFEHEWRLGSQGRVFRRPDSARRLHG